MKQLIKNNKSGELHIKEVPIPQICKGHLLVRNHFSAISIGTETASVDIAKKNLFEKAKERPKDFKKVLELIKKEGFFVGYQRAIEKLSLPSLLGYSSMGEVVCVGEDTLGFNTGDLVACAGSGHAEVILVPKNLCVKVPPKVNFKEAAFTTVGSIAMQAVRQAKVRIGQNVAVVGLGLLGQITMKVLDAAGCKPIGVDIDNNKVQIAKKFGFECYPRDSKTIIKQIFASTNGFGVDSAIITASTKSGDPIEFSSEITRDKGIITVVGAVGLEFSRKNFYDKELTLNLSRSYGPGRYDKLYEEKGFDYPIGFVRFTEKRNMESFLFLLSTNKISLEELITKETKFIESPAFYKDIRSSKSPILGSIIKYSSAPKMEDTIFLSKFEAKKRRIHRVGLIGGGGYAQRTILPQMSKFSNWEFAAMCTNKGMNAEHLSNKYSFEYITTNASKIINDENIDSTVISTRHDTHSDFIIESLNRGKKVYCEKPLTINEEDLDKIIDVLKKGNSDLVIGYNRRFSSLVEYTINAYKDRKIPIAVNYRINAGSLDLDHWAYDREIGGGRIIGELCHFVDLCNYIIGSEPLSVYSKGLYSKDTEKSIDDSATLIYYSDGSVANILYSSKGDQSYSKETIEIFGDNKVISIDDFKKLRFHVSGKTKKINLRKQDKGRNKLFRKLNGFFVDGKSKLIPIEDLINSSRMSFKILQSIRENKPIRVN